MPSLKRAKNGDWLARKAIPAELRDAYQRAYGIRQEERFRVPSGKSPGEAKAAFVEWLADIESRISTLRAAASGQPLELTHRQRQELIGRWYDWFVVQHTDDADTVAAWDLRHDRYQDAVEPPDSGQDGRWHQCRRSISGRRPWCCRGCPRGWLYPGGSHHERYSTATP